MSRLVTITSLAVVLALLPFTAVGQLTDHPIDDIFSDLDRPDSPGVAVLVIQDGEVVYRRGFGQANLEHSIAITPSTVFDIASVSKQFTGMAIAMMIEQGWISLDDDIRMYLPDIPDFGYVITIDHLVHHTSGIRDWPGTLRVAGWQSGDIISFNQILTMATNQRDLNFKPGTDYLYSNTNYNILAYLVETLSGKSFREWTCENIFSPLGMTDTHFHDDHAEIVVNRAQGYEDSDEGLKNISNNLTAIGSSSLYSTLDDLAKWVMNFDDGRVGGMAAVKQMRQRGKLTNGEQIGYAFGQSFNQYRGFNYWMHTGSWAGFRSVIARFPEERFGVVILSNLSSFSPRDAALEIVDRYLGKSLESDVPDREIAANNDVPGISLSRARLDEYAGVYRLGPGRLVTISREGNTLTVQVTGEDKLPMRAISEHAFYVEAIGASMMFAGENAGDVDRLLYGDTVAPRIADKARFTGQLVDYAGNYYSEELDTRYRLSVRQDTLVAHHRRHGDIPLLPLLLDEFRSARSFIPVLEFDRDQHGRVVGLRITQGRSRNIRFIRVDDDD